MTNQELAKIHAGCNPIDDCATTKIAAGRELEQIEMAYRRGFHQGAHAAVEASRAVRSTDGIFID